MLSYADALRLIRATGCAARLPSQRVDLLRARGLVLADDVRARVDVPGFDNAAMDGYALGAADGEPGQVLSVLGEQFAGERLALQVGNGGCVRITTGAPLPAGCDRVVQKEWTRLDGDRVVLTRAVPGGHNLRRQGEDIRAGEVLYPAGTRLDAARLASLAAAGVDAVNVIARPRVAVMTTGDELRRPGEPLASGQIYDSNAVYLQSALRELGFDPTVWPAVRDQPGLIEGALRQLAESFDVVLCCGGVSAGERDLLPGIVRDIGEVIFWKVAMRPGMPFLFGRVGGALVCGMPGNPVSVLATFQQLVLPLLHALSADDRGPRRMQARLLGELHKTHDRLEFVRGVYGFDVEGRCQVRCDPVTQSHRLRAAAQANTLVVVPEGEVHWPEGSVVTISPWSES